MDIDEKYFEENVLTLLDCSRDVRDLESVDFARLRKSYVRWLVKHGGGAAIKDTGLAPLANVCEIGGQARLIRKCKGFDFRLYHSTIRYMLGASAVEQNSGKSIDDAIYVISTQEEYALLEDHLGGGKVQKQFLVEKDGKPYDVLLVVDENGLETKWYFDVADCMMLENLDFSYLEKNMPEDDLEFLDGPEK